MFIFVTFYLFSVLESLSIHDAYGKQNVTENKHLRNGYCFAIIIFCSLLTIYAKNGRVGTL